MVETTSTGAAQSTWVTCTNENPCTMTIANDYARGYHDGMVSSLTIAFAICAAIALIWWLQFLTRRT